MSSSDANPGPAPKWYSRAGGATLGVVRKGFEWIGRHELSVLLAALTFIAALWVFISVADEVFEGDTAKFDKRVIVALRNPDDLKPIGPRWLHEAGRDITALGGVTTLVLITLAVCGFLWLKRLYAALWLVLAATLGGLTASSLLKLLFQRDRPDLVPHLAQVYTTSFPSGHSMMSAVVYLTLGALLARLVEQRRLKAYFLIVALTLTFLVGISRVYMGVHWPTDVLAGWAAGLAWAVLCWLVARSLQKRGKVERSVEQPAASPP